MNGQEHLARVAACLSRLPGVGRRSADRMAFHLAEDSAGLLGELIRGLNELREHVRLCTRCGGMTVASEPVCRLCSNPARESSVVCVVESPSDITALERSGGYRGRYHALMGRISPMHGEGPGSLRLKQLLKRVEEEGFREVVLALNTDVESEATARYVSELLQGRNVRVTRLAYGLPAGSGIGYSDPVTLARAIKGRQPM
jgi:recombination protein RecR